jgi:hypothetical protein
MKQVESGFKLMVKAILQQATSYKWSLQGLGMFRLYLADELRIHVWDPDAAFPGASPMHTHPWDFSSYVVAGKLMQYRYSEVPDGTEWHDDVNLYNKSLLLAGEGGRLVEDPVSVALRRHPSEVYEPGEWYSQKAEEIHWSQPEKGTVTLVFREFRGDLDRDHAYVYWPEGGEWVSAEPRTAVHDEVQRMALYTLEHHFR